MAKKSVKRRKKRASEPLAAGVFSLRTGPVAALLLALYPAVSICATNIKEMSMAEILLPSLAAAAVALLIYGAVLALARDAAKANLASSAVIFVLFFYGYVFMAVSGLKLPLKQDVQQFILLPLLTLAAGAAVFYAFRARKSPAAASLVANTAVAVLFAIPFLQAVYGETAYHKKADVLDAYKGTPVNEAVAGKYPDIYYIILDAHACTETLQRVFGYQGNALTEFFRARGFATPEIRANYPSTMHVLASLLDFDYIDGAKAKIKAGSDSRQYLADIISRKRAVQFLKSKGYSYVIMSSGQSDAELLHGADYIARPAGLTLDAFGQMYYNVTVLQFLNALYGSESPSYENHRRRILYNITRLGDAARIPGPKFVLCHVMAPHPPFVFDADGGKVKNSGPIRFQDGSHNDHFTTDYRQLYAAQVRYIDKLLMENFDGFLNAAGKDSVIIVQGDHGSGAGLNWEDPGATDMRERFCVFAAWRLPGAGAKYPKDGLSTVNTFRILFDAYFGEKLPMLPDRSYFSRWSAPYDFIDVTERSAAAK